MKITYPIILFPDNDEYLVRIPDFDAMTQGSSLTEAIEMARDVIGLMGIVYEDDKKQIPEPTDISDILVSDNEFVYLVDVDFTEYRRTNE